MTLAHSAEYYLLRSLWAAVARILDEYSTHQEEKVRACPEQYFWLHKKRKSAPGLGSMYGGDAP